MKKMWWFILGSVFTGLLFTSMPVLAENVQILFNAVNVTINGTPTDINSISYNGSTYLKAKDVCDVVGKKIEWIESTETVNIINPKQEQTVINYSNGAKYIGEVKDGLPNGKGIMLYPDGVCYIGTFINGKLSGMITVYSPDTVIAALPYSNNVINGDALVWLSNGNKFIAKYSNDKIQNISLLSLSASSVSGTNIDSIMPTIPAGVTSDSGYQAEYDNLTATYNNKIQEYKRVLNTYRDDYEKWAGAYGEGNATVQEKLKTFRDQSEKYTKLINEATSTYNSDAADLKAKYGISN